MKSRKGVFPLLVDISCLSLYAERWKRTVHTMTENWHYSNSKGSLTTFFSFLVQIKEEKDVNEPLVVPIRYKSLSLHAVTMLKSG